MMHLYIVLDHDHFWPVGVASIIVAKDEQQAVELLDHELVERKLKPSAEKRYTLHEYQIAEPYAEILLDGNY